MKTVMNYINEAGRGRPRKDATAPVVSPKDKNPGLDEIEGKDAEHNGTDGKYEYNVKKTDNSAIKKDEIDLNNPDNTDSLNDLIDKFDAKEPFFIVGRAGWGKTSIIKKLADQYNYELVTMYLDKIEATDLGGMPITVKGDDGRPQTVYSMPSFAEKIYKSMLDKNDHTQYLLFFDEMNQAMPDVMNALMPIVLENEIARVKFDNFFVGAAGNLQEENEGGLSELSGPLKSRFKPIIVWETGTPRAWKQAFDHMHKAYKDIFDDKVIDAIDEVHNLFDNPREIEMKLIDFIKSIKSNPEAAARANAAKTLRRIKALSDRDEYTRTEEDQMKKLAELLTKHIKGEDIETKASKKDVNMIDKNLIKVIKNALTNGYQPATITVDGKKKNVKVGISLENISTLVPEDECNAEMLELLIKKFKMEGLKIKYQTDDEWRKDGLEDPDIIPDDED